MSYKKHIIGQIIGGKSPNKKTLRFLPRKKHIDSNILENQQTDIPESDLKNNDFAVIDKNDFDKTLDEIENLIDRSAEQKITSQTIETNNKKIIPSELINTDQDHVITNAKLMENILCKKISVIEKKMEDMEDYITQISVEIERSFIDQQKIMDLLKKIAETITKKN